MTTHAGAPVPLPFSDLIATAAEAATLPPSLDEMPKPERMKHHRRKLDGIALYQGVDGVNEYKKQNPEAASIKVKMDVRAYVPKPAGYNSFLAELAENWLTIRVAANATNVEDVGRLNQRFGTSFHPAKHFSEPLSKSRLERIKKAFAAKGIPLDIGKTNTMSKLRAVARAYWSAGKVDKPFGNVGFISGNSLIVNGTSLTIEKNGERDCIRLPNHLKRRRIYLDELEWLFGLLGEGFVDPLSTTCSIGELDYSAKSAEIEQLSEPEISGMAYGGRALAKRIAALKAAQLPQSTTPSDEGDPLNL